MIFTIQVLFGLEEINCSYWIPDYLLISASHPYKGFTHPNSNSTGK